MPTQLQYLEHHQINKQQWDDIIHQSHHGLIYATSVYLDHMYPGWSAITGVDYSWIMPVTHNKKLMVNYLYQPAFTQQLGVFIKDPNVKVPWQELIAFLKSMFKFWEINLNHTAPADELSKDMEVKAATNFILSLQNKYSSISEHYHKDLQRNLRRAQHFRLVSKPAEHKLCIEEYKTHYGDRMKHVTSVDYEHFEKLCDQLNTKNAVICRKVVDQQNDLMATILLLFDGRRLYNLMNSVTDAGRKVEANHFLVDSVIREFADQDLIFDFEGSDLPGVKSFYENFGPTNQPYFMVKNNSLPFPFRLFK